MLALHGVTEMNDLVGQELGVSGWHSVTQARIDAFAAATDDYQPIHVDGEMARQSPFGTTIAHGLYTLSLGPKFLNEMFSLDGYSVGFNYGYDRVRWLTPVKVNSRIRMKATLAASQSLSGGTRFSIRQTFEIEGVEKPACVAECILVFFD
jgi:acyl dehydratase